MLYRECLKPRIISMCPSTAENDCIEKAKESADYFVVHNLSVDHDFYCTIYVRTYSWNVTLSLSLHIAPQIFLCL